MITKYFQKVKDISSIFEEFDVLHFPRSGNAKMNLLSKLAILEYADLQKMTYLEVLDKPSIEEEPASILQANFEPSWIDPFVDYVHDEKLSEDRREAWSLRISPHTIFFWRRSSTTGHSPYLSSDISNLPWSIMLFKKSMMESSGTT